MRKGLRLAVLPALAALLVGVVYYCDTRLPLRMPGAPPLPLVVSPGMHAEAIGRELWALGLVRHPLVFRILVRERGAGGRLRAGRYSLEGALTLVEVVDLLVRGEVERHAVTVPEGKSLQEAAVLVASKGLSADAFLETARDPAPIRDLDPLAQDLEGYLYPDTYDVALGAPGSRALVSRMVHRFREVMVPQLPRVAQSGLTLREVVTLASIVELETARREERPRIAAVFLNRLHKQMPLQTDPTVIYALRERGHYDGNVRKKDLDLDSPYNTYKHVGLPPGPISSPGRDSLVAVLQPAPVKDLYFVSRNDGTHEFNESLREHEKAVDRYQRHRIRLHAGPVTPPRQ